MTRAQDQVFLDSVKSFISIPGSQYILAFVFAGVVFLLALFRLSRSADMSALSLSPEARLRSKMMEVVKGLQNYATIYHNSINRRRRLYFKMSRSHQSIAVAALRRYKKLSGLADINALMIKDIIAFAKKTYQITDSDLSSKSAISDYAVIELFNHLIRDFADVRSVSRQDLFDPVVERLTKLVPANGSQAPRVLLPGSGVGGLTHTVANLGYQVDGLEFSASMHLGALYSGQETKVHTVYPWILDFSHLRQAEHQLEQTQLRWHQSSANFHYGNFLTFDQGHKYDVIITLFFMDTAENVLDYVDRIEELLAPGGTWINYGPLKWGTAPQVEFAMDELLDVLRAQGWNLQETFEGSNRYTGSETSMWDAKYRLQGWVAQHPV